jgi:hypothetical protein
VYIHAIAGVVTTPVINKLNVAEFEVLLVILVVKDASLRAHVARN